MGIYFITKRRFPWLSRIAFGFLLIQALWSLFFYCKEWVPYLLEYITFQNNKKFTAGLLSENPSLWVRFYGAYIATTLGQGLLYSALWLSIPKKV